MRNRLPHKTFFKDDNHIFVLISVALLAATPADK